MRHALAHAKLNLALVVGPFRDDGKHELATVYQRIELADRLELQPAEALDVVGYSGDTLVRAALEALAARAGVEPRWRVTIEKNVPIAAGLAGGSSDAAAALELANSTLREPLPPAVIAVLAAGLGADVPFFLTHGPQLGIGSGTHLHPLELPQDYSALLVFPSGETKTSTADVYRAFDARRGEIGFARRRDQLLAALENVHRPSDLARLPSNDLAKSPLSEQLRDLGAFRADVSGAGPTVFGLFERSEQAALAATIMASAGETRLTRPAW